MMSFKVITIFLVILTLSVQVSAWDEEEWLAHEEESDEDDSSDEDEWIDHGKRTLNWGDTWTIDEYIIEATDFSSNYKDTAYDWTTLKIYENGICAGTATLSLNNSLINDTAIFCDDKLKIVAREIITGYNRSTPYTKVQVYLAVEEPAISPEQWINDTLDFSKLLPVEPSEIYLSDWINVELRLKNKKNVDLNITITDIIPDNFELVPDPDQQLTWNLSLKGYEEVSIRQYSIKATEPGEYTVPVAWAMVECNGANFTKMSNSPEIFVRGPSIDLTKTAIIQDDGSIAVTVSVTNVGNRAAHVWVTDNVPENSELIDGEPDFDMVAQPDESYSNEYIIIAEHDIELPPAEAMYRDDKERSYLATSESVIPTEPASPTKAIPDDENEIDEDTDETLPQDGTIRQKLGAFSLPEDIFLYKKPILLSGAVLCFLVVCIIFRMCS